MEFLKNQPRLSFLYDGKTWTDHSPQKSQKLEENSVITTYRFSDGFTLTNIAKRYPRHGAYEWVNVLENTGNVNSKIVSELWDCDVLFPAPHREKEPSSPWNPSRETEAYVMTPNGSTTVDEFDFHAHVNDGGTRQSFLFPEQPPKCYRNGEGRSSHGNAPFFNIHEAGRGYFAAVGWTGQWNARIARTSDGILFRSKIEDTHFYLKPGEKLRTSSVVILPYESSVEDSFNLWRTLLRQEFSPTVSRLDELPFCANFWGGTESEKIIRGIQAIDQAKIPFNHFWIDAGWYGEDTLPSRNEFSGDWGEHTGDWEVSPHIHPQGMKDVTDAIHQSGRRFVLWFEPERVRKTSSFAGKHPEYLLKKEGSQNLLLNLGNEDAFRYVAELLCDMIERLRIDCYRQDFNGVPLPHWRQNETEDRRGITEIKHITGMYRLWDLLLERFPHLIIDNCASGGKRLDIETLKRSIPLWRSDAQCPADPIPEITQAHHMNFSLWMPYTGTGSGRVYDTYRMRSAYAPCLSTTYSYSADESFGENPENVAWLKERAEEYLRIRPYFDGDIYHLTEPIRDDAAWCALQWDRPERGDGLIQVFKRERSPYPEAIFDLRKIDENARYRFTDLDGGCWETDGKTLREKGFCLRIAEKQAAKLYIYEKTGR